jgi:phosphatidylglycerophosphatase A
VGPIGWLPVAPGTAGAAVAVCIFVLFSLWIPDEMRGFPALAIWLGGTAALTAVGVPAAERAGRHFECEDDGRIVVDEVAGQWLTLAPLLAVPGAALSAPWVVTGFVLFRVFDIWKPGPVRWAERRFPGGLGVMLDDVVAGVLGAVVLSVALGFASGAFAFGAFACGGQAAG